MSIEQEFRDNAACHGVILVGDIIANGTLNRIHIQGHKPGSKNGSYVLFTGSNTSAGWFGDFKSGISFKWHSGKKGAPLPFFERTKLNKAIADHAEAIATNHTKAAQHAQNEWNQASLADKNYPYLQRKMILPHGTKISNSGALMVPLYSAENELVSLQFIDQTGDKKFLSGGRKIGSFWRLGNETHTIYIAEGFATAASVHEHTGMHTIVAFDAGNLGPVSLTIRKLHPMAEIIIAGDNDLSGTGQEAAKNAALSVGGKYILPPDTDTDWNDYFLAAAKTNGDAQ